MSPKFRVFFQVFCCECGWSIKFDDQYRGQCANKKCPEFGNLVQLTFKVMKVRPIVNDFHRPLNAPLKPI